MPTQLIYQTDSYQRQFPARVVSTDVEQRLVELDATAFYPGGGGQPYDTGSLTTVLDTYPVVRAQKQGDRVVHLIGGERSLPEIGVGLTGELDWERRYSLMRTHTAMHILCGVVFRDYAAQVTGGDMEPLNGRMDFEFESLTRDLIKVIEAAINVEVQAARPISVAILPREEAFEIPDLIRTKINLLPEGIQHIRTVKIEGLDHQADGGTHVRNTSEVGRIRVIDYKSKGRINKRIYVQVDELSAAN